MKRFDAEEEILAVIRSFEEATISRDVWKHREHLTVALYYVIHHDIETATEKMRSGLLNLLTNGFGIDLEKEMPYHETITVFWIRTVADFEISANGSSFLDKANDLVSRYDKDYPLRFYSRELLFSDEARKRFVRPDLEVV